MGKNNPLSPLIHPVSSAAEFYKLAGDFWHAWNRERDGRLLGALNSVQRANGGVGVLSYSRRQVSLVQISAEDTDSPETISLSLFRTDKSVARPSAPLFVQALISWGAGKSKQSVLCDFHHGTRLTLDCSSVEVSAILTTAASELTTPDIEVGVGCVYGSLVRLKPLTLTVPSATINAAAFADFAIPPFARAVTIITDSATTSMEWQYTNNVGAAVTLARATLGGAGGPPTNLLIPNGSETLRLTNGAAVAGLYQVIWELDL
jgi:hypothetical protein